MIRQVLYPTRSSLVNFPAHLLRSSALHPKQRSIVRGPRRLALANFLSWLRVSATLLERKICGENSPNLTARGIIFVLFALQVSAAESAIEKYFKPAVNKTGVHSMRNIDFIYMINLDKRPEKYANAINALSPYGIEPYRFSAVNGWELTYQAIDDLGAKYQPGTPHGGICSVFRHIEGKEIASFEIMKEENVSYYCHSLSRGAIGCIMSHLSVLQDAYVSGYETIWVLEDDIRVVEDPRILSEIIDQLDRLVPGWDVFFTDPESKGSDGNRVYCGGIRPRPNFAFQSLETYRQRYNVNENIVKLGLRFGSYSMIIRRSGVEKLLNYFKTYLLFFPYDMEYFFPPGIRLYSCTRDIVTTIAGGISDNGNPTYEK